MATKEVKYSKEFLSKTSSYEDCRKEIFYQTEGKEDSKIWEAIKSGFLFFTDCNSNRFGVNNRYLGFDGKQQYEFSRSSSNLTTNKENPTQNTKYDCLYEIKKAGNKNDLENLCDLEEFLLEKGFEKVKNSK